MNVSFAALESKGFEVDHGLRIVTAHTPGDIEYYRNGLDICRDLCHLSTVMHFHSLHNAQMLPLPKKFPVTPMFHAPMHPLS